MKRNEYYAIGGMSGTSLDGVDLCYCRYYKNKKKHWQFELLAAHTFPYPTHLKQTIQQLTQNYTDSHTNLDTQLGAFYAELIQQFIQEHHITKIDFVANHGQTVYHNPAEQKTVQIGCGKTIAEQTNITTVNNFRVIDMTLGGQGAPLVPIGDWHFFNEYRFCINLGGICNITIQEPKAVLLAFDVCPCNILLNYYAKQKQLAYDDNGNLARSGQLNEDLLQNLNGIQYYDNQPPKSLDAQQCLQLYIPIIETFNLPTENILHTLCHHYAIQLAQVIHHFKKDVQEQILLSGGGALNGYLCEQIETNTDIVVHVPDEAIINYKEAIIFGLLGVLKLEDEVNCLKVVTGAAKDNVGGEVHIA